MPLTVEYKIGKKKRGNWNTPIVFNIIIEGKELQTSPHIVFKKEYVLPEYIFLGNRPNMDERRIYQVKCNSVKEINIDINRLITKPVKINLFSLRSICREECDNCKAYIPWKPGKPDFRDFEEVFYTIATDLCAAWNKAVEESSTIFCRKRSLPARKVIV